MFPLENRLRMGLSWFHLIEESMVWESFKTLTETFSLITWQDITMMAVGCVLIYLAIAKDYEPVLLLPIGFGAILANIPLTGITDPAEHGLLAILLDACLFPIDPVPNESRCSIKKRQCVSFFFPFVLLSSCVLPCCPY